MPLPNPNYRPADAKGKALAEGREPAHEHLGLIWIRFCGRAPGFRFTQRAGKHRPRRIAAAWCLAPLSS